MERGQRLFLSATLVALLVPSPSGAASRAVRKDEDLDLLRDAVHSEKVKIARIEKLVKGQKSVA